MMRRLWMAPLLYLIATGTVCAAQHDSAHGAAVFEYPSTGKALLDGVLSVPSKQLVATQVLRGRFTHTKHLAEIPQPLTASGEFVFARDLGVYWHTEKPFDSVFVLTRHGIVERDEGAETLHLSADEQPAVRIIANIFMALFTLDIDALDTSFDLYGKPAQPGADAHWTIGLRPKSSAVASVFDYALVSGDREVRQVVLNTRRGDRTVIDLHDVTYRSDAPDAATRALFAR